MSHYALVVFIVTYCWGPLWMSSINLVVDQGDLYVPGDSQQWSKYGYIYHASRYFTWAELCYCMSVSNKLYFLLVNVILISPISATIIFTVKRERNNIAFTNKDNCKGEFNWNMSEITLPDSTITLCIFCRLCFGKRYFLF